MTGREKFEKWWEDWFGEAPISGWDALWCGDGYSSEQIDHMWDAWQASRDEEIELPSTAFIQCQYCADEAMESVEMAIRAAGFNVKGG